MQKTAILIGFGGMGKRYYKTLKLMNFKILAICETKRIFFSDFKDEKNITFLSDYKKLLNFKADLLCVACNTNSRFEIIKNFCNYGNIKRIITEKPLATNYKKSLEIFRVVKQKKIRLVVNTHRTLSPNYFLEYLDNKLEKLSKISE